MDTEENEIKHLEAEGLVTLAWRYYASRFPSPQRLACPPPGEITKVAPRRRAPEETLREHMFKCSECFNEYRQAPAQRRPAPDEVVCKARSLRRRRRAAKVGSGTQ